jgi:hypothetical protein
MAQQDQNQQGQQGDDLDRELADALSAASAATLSPEEEERARKLAAIEEARAARRIAEAKRRRIAGDALEREARAEAGGRYLVRAFDLGSLFPDVPSEQIPGGGVLVLRSHPPEAKRSWDREVEAKARDLSEINADLVCASIVRPRMSADQGVRFRAWLESEMGCGVANQLLAPVLELGGARVAETKRGR